MSRATSIQGSESGTVRFSETVDNSDGGSLLGDSSVDGMQLRSTLQRSASRKVTLGGQSSAAAAAAVAAAAAMQEQVAAGRDLRSLMTMRSGGGKQLQSALRLPSIGSAALSSGRISPSQMSTASGRVSPSPMGSRTL